MKLRSYQRTAVDFVTSRFTKKPGSGLWLGCGLGKTAVCLHAIDELRDWRNIKRTIIVAPATVIATSWPKEIRQWGLDISYAWLTTHNWEEVRAKNPDILFINTEALSLRKIESSKPQLAERLLKSKISADLIVIDEVTKFKNWSAARTKVLKKVIRNCPRRVTLTGSPTPNSLGEIFPQHYLLDEGETLTPYIGNFRDAYMRPCGYENREWEMDPNKVEPLMAKLRPWYLCQEAVDHLDMPELIENIVEVELPKAALAKYRQMEKEMYAELDTGDEVTALTSGSKYNYCRQMASGCVYDDEKDVSVVHKAKVERLRDLIDEMNGHPLLVAYWYRHEGAMLAKEFPNAVVVGRTTSSELVAIIERWQKGEIPVMLAQAGKISHGVDGLQKGCNDLCWFTLSDNPDIVHQLLHRVYRQGNDGNKVRLHYLIAVGTVDRKVLRAIREKAASQSEVLRRIKMSGVDE